MLRTKNKKNKKNKKINITFVPYKDLKIIDLIMYYC